MEIKINVYADCTSEEPSKTYTIRRILFKTAKELGQLQAEASEVDEKKQEEYTLKMLKCVFPNFEDEDLNGVDPIELGQFFRKLGAEISGVVANAQKN